MGPQSHHNVTNGMLNCYNVTNTGDSDIVSCWLFSAHDSIS